MSGYAYDTSTTAYSVLAHAGLSVVDLDPYAGLSFTFVAESYAAFSSSVSVRLELLATYAGLSFILETANTFVAEKVVGLQWYIYIKWIQSGSFLYYTDNN